MGVNIDIERILNIGIMLSSERNTEKLLDIILTEIRRVTCADAGTIYLLYNDKLYFKIVQNETMNTFVVDGKEWEPVPLVPENVCAYAALQKRIVNIEDVYNSREFDFTGPKRYDSVTGYRTQSMLVVPLVNIEDELIGVVQLINAKDETGAIIPFDEEYLPVVRSLASQSAITLSNVQFVKEINDLFYSFVKVMTSAIDARTPYNTHHTCNLVELLRKFLPFVNRMHDEGKTDQYFDSEREEQICMAAWLHDVGKVVTPTEIINKPGRLSEDERVIMNDHVLKTEQFLSNIKFSRQFRDVPQYAGMHHEFLDGSGYPHKLRGKQIPYEAQLLTVLDIFEAMTASDRPYKRAFTADEAIGELRKMANDGKLNSDIVELLAMSNILDQRNA